MSAPSLPGLLVSHWEASWPLDVTAVLAAALYLLGTRRARRWPARRTVSFLAGTGCVVVALQSGIGAYDDELLSAHMAQHMLLLMVAPLLVLGGTPAILALRALPAGGRRRFARLLARLRPVTRPSACLAVFYATVLVTHLPWLYDATLRQPVLHEAEHLLYLIAGLLLWWPILDADPVRAHRLGGLGRLGYMLAAMPVMALVGAYLNRHAAVVYAPYGPAAHRLGASALADQAQAGAIMWVLGNVVTMAVGLWAAIDSLVAEERRQRVREAHAPSLPSVEGPRT